MVFRGAAPLAQFYTHLVAAVSRFSLQLTAENTLKVGPSLSCWYAPGAVGFRGLFTSRNRSKHVCVSCVIFYRKNFR